MMWAIGLVAAVLLTAAASVAGLILFEANSSGMAGTTLLQFAANAWALIRPALSLLVILIVLDWFVGRTAYRFRRKDSEDLESPGLMHLMSQWGATGQFPLLASVQSLLAVLIILAFCLAALSGSVAADTLKDLALVVVGFYFGSKGNELATAVADRLKRDEATPPEGASQSPSGETGVPPNSPHSPLDKPDIR